MSRSKSAVLFILGSLISTSIFAAMPAATASASGAQSPQVSVVAPAKLANLLEVEKEAVSKPSGTWVTSQKYPSLFGSLSGIATVAYKNSGMWPGLCAYNNIQNCNAIDVGQKIFVPNVPVVVAPPVTPVKKPVKTNTVSTQTVVGHGNIDRVVNFALAQIGKPYVWAATGPSGYDCSGLVVASYANIGINLPHFTGDLLNRGHAVSRSNLQVGDLVFPSYGHVMIYIGNGKVVHAPHRGANVQVGTIYAFYAARRIV